MFYYWEKLVDYFIYSLLGLDKASHLTSALHFFIFDTIKIFILLLLIMGLQHPRLKILLPLFRVSPPLSRKMRPYFCVSVLPYLHRLADPPLGFGPEWLERCRTVRLMGIWPQF